MYCTYCMWQGQGRGRPVHRPGAAVPPERPPAALLWAHSFAGNSSPPDSPPPPTACAAPARLQVLLVLRVNHLALWDYPGYTPLWVVQRVVLLLFWICAAFSSTTVFGARALGEGGCGEGPGARGARRQPLSCHLPRECPR
jgi:hypothetical protein